MAEGWSWASRGGAGSGLAQETRICRAIREMTPSVRRALYRFGIRGCDIDDALQGVFTVFARRIADIEHGAEAAFLKQAARRTAADFRRARQRRREDVVDFANFELPDSTLQAPDEALLRHEHVARLLARIPESRRQVLTLFWLEGLTLHEIATSLSLPYGTVASRLHRARAALSSMKKRSRHLAG